jgi:hypothetical protein
MIGALTIPTPSLVTITVSGAWSQQPPWDWKGSVTAPEPIVAMTFLRVGNHVEWVRSEKTVHAEMEIRLLLGRYDSKGLDVQACFSVGENTVRWRTMLDHANALPTVPGLRQSPAGQSFPFCALFGTPEIALYALVLLRRQAVSARLGIWHLKAEYSSLLPPPWNRVFTYGRAGAFEMTDLNVEPDGPANGSQPIRSETNRTSSAADSRR